MKKGENKGLNKEGGVKIGGKKNDVLGRYEKIG